MTTKWLALVVAVFALLATQASGGPSSKSRKQAAKPAPPPAAVQQEEVVDGYGQTAELARENALKNGRERVEKLLLKRLGPSGWWPAEEQVSTEFLLAHEVLKPVGEPELAAEVNVDGKPGLVARCRVALTPSYLKEIETTARQQTVQDRHSVLARVLGGILAVVLVTAAYLRLEESTRGYATKLLRLAAVIVLAVVGAALFLTR
jgi:hypothetical protein